MAWHNNIDQNWYSKSQKAKVHVLPCSTPIQTVLQVLPIRLHSYTVLPCRLYSPVDCTPLWTVLPHTAAQAVLAHTGLICTPTQYSPVDCTPMWTVLPCGLYSHTLLHRLSSPTLAWSALLHSTPLWTVLPCGLYSPVDCTPTHCCTGCPRPHWLDLHSYTVLPCGLYSHVDCTPPHWLDLHSYTVLPCRLYSPADCTPTHCCAGCPPTHWLDLHSCTDFTLQQDPSLGTCTPHCGTLYTPMQALPTPTQMWHSQTARCQDSSKGSSLLYIALLPHTPTTTHSQTPHQALIVFPCILHPPPPHTHLFLRLPCKWVLDTCKFQKTDQT